MPPARHAIDGLQPLEARRHVVHVLCPAPRRGLHVAPKVHLPEVRDGDRVLRARLHVPDPVLLRDLHDLLGNLLVLGVAVAQRTLSPVAEGVDVPVRKADAVRLAARDLADIARRILRQPLRMDPILKVAHAQLAKLVPPPGPDIPLRREGQRVVRAARDLPEVYSDYDLGVVQQLGAGLVVFAVVAIGVLIHGPKAPQITQAVNQHCVIVAASNSAGGPRVQRRDLLGNLLVPVRVHFLGDVAQTKLPGQVGAPGEDLAVFCDDYAVLCAARGRYDDLARELVLDVLRHHLQPQDAVLGALVPELPKIVCTPADNLPAGGHGERVMRPAVHRHEIEPTDTLLDLDLLHRLDPIEVALSLHEDRLKLLEMLIVEFRVIALSIKNTEWNHRARISIVDIDVDWSGTNVRRRCCGFPWLGYTLCKGLLLSLLIDIESIAGKFFIYYGHRLPQICSLNGSFFLECFQGFL